MAQHMGANDYWLRWSPLRDDLRFAEEKGENETMTTIHVYRIKMHWLLVDKREDEEAKYAERNYYFNQLQRCIHEEGL